jgi:acyl carrier protein
LDQSEICTNLAAYIAKIASIPSYDIRPDDSLDTLGVDSAATISLSAHIEATFGVEVDESDLAKNTSVKELASIILKKRESNNWKA